MILNKRLGLGLTPTVFAVNTTQLQQQGAGEMLGSLEASWVGNSWTFEFPLRSTNVLQTVPPPSNASWQSLFLPGDLTLAKAKESPFHVYHPDFYAVVGSDPRLAVVRETEGFYSAHEAPGSPLGFSGIDNSNSVYRFSMAEAEGLLASDNVFLDDRGDWIAGNISVQTISGPEGRGGELENVNGGTNYRGQVVFLTQGRGEEITSGMTLINPVEPFNSTVILNNFFGRQFNSLNDVAFHRKTGELFFTDPDYGNNQGFRPTPGLPFQVYRWNETSGLVSIVADGFGRPNGIVFSPDERTAYVADTGLIGVDREPLRPATIYAYDVDEEGFWSGKRTFAFINTGVPDGVRCDKNGNVYAGTGDGVTVWNPKGVLLGKIFIGSGAANFQWAGPGRMVILAESKVYVAKLQANGDPVWRQ